MSLVETQLVERDSLSCITSYPIIPGFITCQMVVGNGISIDMETIGANLNNKMMMMMR